MSLEPVRYAPVAPPAQRPAGPAPAVPPRARAPLPNAARDAATARAAAAVAARAQAAAEEAAERQAMRLAKRRAERMSGLTVLVSLVFYFLAVAVGGAVISSVYGAMALLFIVPAFLLLGLGFWVRAKRRRNTPGEGT